MWNVDLPDDFAIAEAFVAHFTDNADNLAKDVFVPPRTDAACRVAGSSPNILVAKLWLTMTTGVESDAVVAREVAALQDGGCRRCSK